MSKQYYDENGNPVVVKKKGGCLKWVIGIVLLIILIGACTSLFAEEETNPNDNQPTETEETSENEEVESTENDVPREYENALASAQNYVDIMPFSEKGLYQQLTSEAGDQYPEEAAQYAIENVEVDYNEEALEAAENYQDTFPMSDAELFNQLTSEAGDQFTNEQAQYAIDNLED